MIDDPTYWAHCPGCGEATDGRLCPECMAARPFRFHFPVEDLPAWINRHPRRDYLAAKWLGRARTEEGRAAVRAIYREARRRRARGEDVVVDHREPLCSDWVCGLHVIANLRIIGRGPNARKGNGADHPELDLPDPGPHQRTLAL